MLRHSLANLGVFLILGASLASAQVALEPAIADKVSNGMDSGITRGELACHTQTFKPFLDFALRFEAGWVISCRLGQFEGEATRLASYVRVTPRGGKPMVFGEMMQLPQLPAQRRARMNWKSFHDEIEFSGSIALGEGEYLMEQLLVDEHSRTHRKKWNLKVAPHGKEKSVLPTLGVGTAVAVSFAPWQHAGAETGESRRVTVFLDAAPLFPSALKLRAWDRAFLLGSLSSLLRQVRASQVRLVVFNLDQQREIFREDDFSPPSFHRLMNALQALELGTVSYQTLQRENAWADLLVKLVNEEVSAVRPSDAVIFLGPNMRILDKIDPEYVRARADIGQRLYYFEYFTRVGYEFPDAIHQLTNTCKGTVFKVHSPADFAASIAKLQQRLGEEHWNH